MATKNPGSTHVFDMSLSVSCSTDTEIIKNNVETKNPEIQVELKHSLCFSFFANKGFIKSFIYLFTPHF